MTYGRLNWVIPGGGKENPMDDRVLPVINIEGERVALGPLRHDLIPTYQRWNNDAATNRATAGFRPTTFEQESVAFDAVTKDPTYALFTVYDRAAWRAIGMTYLSDIELRNRTAEFGIVIGEADDRGQGYGTEATRLTLDYAFTALGLNSVGLWVADFNLAGRRCYAKVGFREAGRWPQARWFDGCFRDEILMVILAEEFASPVLRHAWAGDV
jgi:diamine N-acetyltransferase